MALRGLLYRKLVEKKKQPDKKAGEKSEKIPAKKIPAPAQKVSVFKRFLERPREKDLKYYPKKEFKSIRTGRMTPRRLIQNKMATDSKQTDVQQRVGVREGIVKGRARYWGGHFLYPIGEAEKGELMIQNGTLTFVKSGFSGKRSMNIPVRKIDWKKVSQIVRDTAYPVTCFSIPFRDDKGIVQNPVFSVDESPARENFSRFLYERMTKKK